MILTRNSWITKPSSRVGSQCSVFRALWLLCQRDPITVINPRSYRALQDKHFHRDYTDYKKSSGAFSSATVSNDLASSEKVTKDEALAEKTIPWYLQVQTPAYPDINPLAERQRLPELPTEPPPLLQPILEQVSVSLGLDDLRLFDLRDIDPPLALGANLMVIIGTGRSEKHIHVSADRFCRWLRTEHKLRPYADGLLGRGELKLKMRRKARRARTMSHVGVTEAGQFDDGIRTGWVCVNIGTIEDGRPHFSDSAGMENYVGFGSNMGGVNVVVQMLVQEKREELELEQLLGSKLRRHERKQKQSLDAQEQAGGSATDYALMPHILDTPTTATTTTP